MSEADVKLARIRLILNDMEQQLSEARKVLRGEVHG